MMQQPLFRMERVETFQNRNRIATTFKGKLEEPVHRWFRLTPSFSPQLARDIFDDFRLQPHHRILEPYCGTGTVPLEARRRGNESVGVEINPALHFVAKVKTDKYDVQFAKEDLVRFRRHWNLALGEISEPQTYLQNNPNLIPAISYPERWWAPGTLAQLAAARSTLRQTESYAYPDLVRFAIASVVIEVSSARHNHPSMSFADGPAVEKDACDAFDKRCRQLIEDISAEPPSVATAQIYHGNTKEIATILKDEAPFDALVTSPPYPNRFSYARETRPVLFFLDLVREAGQVGDIEVAAMGGTWGKATWQLQKPVEPCNDLVRRLLLPFTDKMGETNPILKHYVIRYFNDLWEHATQVDQVMASSAKMAWVVGNAKMVGNEVHTDQNVARMFEELGWYCNNIVSMRKRHSKRGLHESVVFLSRG